MIAVLIHFLVALIIFPMFHYIWYKNSSSHTWDSDDKNYSEIYDYRISHCRKDFPVRVLRDIPLSSSFPVISKWINENSKRSKLKNLPHLPSSCCACYPSSSLSCSLLIGRGTLFQFYSCNWGIRFVEPTLFLLSFYSVHFSSQRNQPNCFCEVYTVNWKLQTLSQRSLWITK